MYCSACGAAVTRGLTYCNHCGAKMTRESDNVVKSAEVKPESLVWAMVAVLVFGFVAVVFLMMAMKMVGLGVGPILAFTIVSFLIMSVVEGVFISQLLGRKRGTKETADMGLSKEHGTKELYETQARVLPEPMPSVTEHTTRTFEPIYSERKSK